MNGPAKTIAYAPQVFETAGLDAAKAVYGANLARLQKIKAEYDPNNFFHINQNIFPARDAASQ